jgi:hypothetical protein
MEELKNKIRDKFNTLGWSSVDDKWTNERTVTVNQGRIIINGKPIQKRGQEKLLSQSFEITGDCVIEDNDSGRIDKSLMCKWSIEEDGVTVGHLETNISPNEYDSFEFYCNKFFGL